jgi:hypothetical protein
MANRQDGDNPKQSSLIEALLGVAVGVLNDIYGDRNKTNPDNDQKKSNDAALVKATIPDSPLIHNKMPSGPNFERIEISEIREKRIIVGCAVYGTRTDDAVHKTL